MTPQSRKEKAKGPRESKLSSRVKSKPVKQDRYVPLRNKQRQYRDVKTGVIISNRQYKKAVLTGGKSLEKFRQERAQRGIISHMKRYGSLVEMRQRELSSAGIKESKRAIMASSEMQQLIRDLRTKDKSASGRKARALVQLGLRDVSWTHAVGETNPDHLARR